MNVLFTGISPLAASWNQAAIDKLNEYQVQELGATLVSVTDDVFSMRLRVGEMDIGDQMVSCGVARTSTGPGGDATNTSTTSSM